MMDKKMNIIRDPADKNEMEEVAMKIAKVRTGSLPEGRLHFRYFYSTGQY